MDGLRNSFFISVLFEERFCLIKRPLLYLAVAYGFGVVFHFFFPCAPQWPLGLALVSFIMLVVLCKMAKPGTGLAVFLCFIFLGIMMAALDTPDNENNIYTSYWEHHVHLTGMVVSEPDIRMDYTQYHLQVIHIALGEKQESDTGLVIIRTDKDVPILQYGTHVKAQGYFYMPKAPGNPGQFDYRAYLLQQGLNGILIVDTQEDLQYKDVGGGNGFLLSLIHI